MAETDPLSRQDPDPADNPVSHLLPDTSDPPAYSADEGPPLETPPVKKPGFIRSWLATSTNLRPTSDPSDIEWGIHWYTPVSIVLLLLVGTSTAITHHLIYTALDAQAVGGAVQQRWTSWIGSGLGFLTKVTLTAALGISRTQWVWLTLRKKWLTLTAIDSLFGVISDPTLFLDWRMMRQAKVATVMAIMMWVVPLAAILTPGTLSVKTVAITDTVDCFVPSLLFEFDDLSNATPTAIGLNDTPLPFYKWDESKKVFLYGLAYTPAFKLPAYTGTIARLPDLPPVELAVLAPVESPGRSTLGQHCGSNCTYTIQFLGPAITCSEFTAWNNTEWHNLTAYMQSNLLRAVDTPHVAGSFLVGIDLYTPGKKPASFSCKSTTAHYTIQQTIEDRRFQEPIITKLETVELPDFEPVPIFPNTRYLSPYGLFLTLSGMLVGFLGGTYGGDSESRNTLLIIDIYDNPSNIGHALELLSHKMIASMIAFDIGFVDTHFILGISAIQKTQCHTTENVPVYAYSPLALLIVYSLAVACALATSVAGFIALAHNGMASSKAVSAIIRTTRNSTLDECIVGGDSLGGDVMSSELQKVQLRFGALHTGKMGTAPFAMGVKGEIYPIQRD